MIESSLTPDEMHCAASHGVWRLLMGMIKGRKDNNADGKYDWDRAVESCCAELAYCKAAGVFWSGLQRVKSPDANDVEIRWTGHFGTGGLIINPKDENSSLFVLLDGAMGYYRIVGCLYAKDGKLPCYLHPKGYYLIPRIKLLKFQFEPIP